MMGRMKMHTIPLDTVSLQKRKKNNRAIFWKWMGKAKAVRSYLPGMVSTVLFGLAECFTLPSFFMFSLLFASVQQKGKPLKGCITGMIGLIILRLIWGLEAGISTAIVFLFTAIAMRKPFARSRQMYITMAAVLCVCVIMQWKGYAGADGKFRLIAGAVLALCTMPANLHSAEMLKQGTNNGIEDDMMCFSIPVMIGIAGAAHISMFSVNLGVTAAGFVVLMIGWTCGALTGAAAGIGLGFALVSGGQHAVHLMYMPMAGMLCGCFRDRKRIHTGAVYACVSAALVYVMLRKLPPYFVINHAVIVMMFVLIPSGKINKYRKLLFHLQWSKPGENEYLRIRMLQWVDNIHKLAQVLPSVEMPMDSVEEESEVLAEKLCEHCDRLPICWHDAYENTKQGMGAVLACQDIQLPVINHHFNECERLSKIPGILEEIHRRRKEIRDKNRIAAYDRNMMITHLMALSQAAQLISLEGMMVDEEEREWTRQIRNGLEKIHYPVDVSFVKKVDGHIQIGIHSDSGTLQPAMVQRIIRQIRLEIGKQVFPALQKAGRIVLEETPVFDLISGHASASAAVQEKGSIPANGDAVMVRGLSARRIIFALSDGMGHGIQARNESNRTLEMLAVCMQAGYDGEQTMRVVNGAMLSATGGESFATLDMGVVDLWTGETRITKFGACSSFVVQGQKISRMTGESLPIGIMEQVYPAEKVLIMEEDDRILMMSDGVADLFATDDDVIRLIQKYRNDTPQMMAEMILQEAMDRQQYAPADDMTVLCVQLALRHPSRQYKKSIPA